MAELGVKAGDVYLLRSGGSLLGKTSDGFVSFQCGCICGQRRDQSLNFGLLAIDLGIEIFYALLGSVDVNYHISSIIK